MSSSSSQVRVGVRVRPLTAKEHAEGGKSVVQTRARSVMIGERSFAYDQVFDASISQATLYEKVAPNLIQSVLDGYNATIMAYGQTGSGKTYTMGSEAHAVEYGDNAGLIPRFMHAIFHFMQEKKNAASANTDSSSSILVDYSVQASFLEVYGEDVHDLLVDGGNARQALPLRDDANGGVVVSGLTQQTVSSAQQALQVLQQGTLHRTTAATLMNLTSSRSHAVFTIHLSQTMRDTTTGTDQNVTVMDITTTSKFTFVDLAGSERMKKTGAQGERAREGIKINEGLLALGNVINALADDSRQQKATHVPYRQSKLTRLLQDALGGNSQTLFIACVSPADTNASETLSTLHYANRARNIQNVPTKNIDGHTLELQRLHQFNQILVQELVQLKFGTDNAIKLLDTQPVKDYLASLRQQATSQQDALPTLSAFALSQPPPPTMQFLPTPPIEDKEDMLDNSILEEVNPEEELAILDQLLELQQRDQEFNRQHKEGQEELKQVQGELEEQEAMLLQLRDSLKIYHNMKEKYQMLMAEVQQLEVEKASLADQLEKATADPTKGCSLAIKKKLERVETSLVRARIDARKHQQKYREAEQQAQKCKALERKIAELKQGKVAMIRKQKEAEAKHRDFTEAKTRELLALKKRERNADRKVSKLQSEILIHKNNLVKRRAYTDKIAAKLKETESHLMKLLSMRQRELKRRTSIMVPPGRRTTLGPLPQTTGFAKANSQELESMKLLLQRMIQDRVALEQSRLAYQERAAEYGELMRQIVEEVRILEQSEDKQQEQTVEELELKLEIVTSELEDLKSRLGSNEDESEVELKAKATIENLSAPTVRTLLWEFVDKFATAELEKQRHSKSLERKNSVIESFEAEVQALNQKIALLSTDLADRRALAQEDPVEIIRCLRQRETELSKKVEQAESKSRAETGAAEEMKKEVTVMQLELQDTKEKLALANTIVRQREETNIAEETLQVLQKLWRRIGLPEEKREEIRRAIMSSLEDTCQRLVKEARALKDQVEQDIKALRSSIDQMSTALGKQYDQPVMDASSPTLMGERDQLQAIVDVILPEFNGAVDRKMQIIRGIESVMHALDLQHKDLTTDLASLMESRSRSTHLTGQETSAPVTGKEIRAIMRKNVEDMLLALEEEPFSEGKIHDHAPNSLDSDFLERCEKDLTDFRMVKSKKVVANSEARAQAHRLVTEMNLSEDDIFLLLTSSSSRPIPTWWQQEIASNVIDSIVHADAIVGVSKVFADHLQHVVGVLELVSQQRGALSSSLKPVIERAQRTLLATVGEEADASEAYASFHEALFNLPSLSKDHIFACIEEINALTAGVEAMMQSEIEALTVIWEALHIDTMERSKFWGDIDQNIKSFGANSKDLFEFSQADVEEWVAMSTLDASKACQVLNTRLHKLEEVHSEVERLRSKQDAKSRIISLDSEIRILSATLAEFEEKKCNKQRLLTKKSGSSTLLREERYRRQMQGKFTTKLEHLAAAVKAWKETDGHDFEGNILSEEVRVLLENPDKMDSLVEKRTEFMHLRTVQPKPAAKRPPSKTPGASPLVKRQRSGSSAESAGSSDSDKSNVPGWPRPSSRTARKPGSDRLPVAAPPANEGISRKRRAETSSGSRSPIKPRTRRRKEEPGALKRSPFSPNSQAPQKKKDKSLSNQPKTSKRDTMMPFGHVLGDQSPQTASKENFP